MLKAIALPTGRVNAFFPADTCNSHWACAGDCATIAAAWLPPLTARRLMPAADRPFTTATAAPPATSAAPRWYLLAGFAILVACQWTGEELKARLGLILPGNILGLFILLLLLTTGAVPLRWVEGIAHWLLWLLPLLFVPIFVLALQNKSFWQTRGPALGAVMLVATVMLWAGTGHLAQWLLRRRAKKAV